MDEMIIAILVIAVLIRFIAWLIGKIAGIGSSIADAVSDASHTIKRSPALQRALKVISAVLLIIGISAFIAYPSLNWRSAEYINYLRGNSSQSQEN